MSRVLGSYELLVGSRYLRSRSRNRFGPASRIFRTRSFKFIAVLWRHFLSTRGVLLGVSADGMHRTAAHAHGIQRILH